MHSYQALHLCDRLLGRVVFSACLYKLDKAILPCTAEVRCPTKDDPLSSAQDAAPDAVRYGEQPVVPGAAVPREQPERVLVAHRHEVLEPVFPPHEVPAQDAPLVSVRELDVAQLSVQVWAAVPFSERVRVDSPLAGPPDAVPLSTRERVEVASAAKALAVLLPGLAELLAACPAVSLQARVALPLPADSA